MRFVLFFVGIVVLIVAEVARVYYIMPFPGSQVDNVIDLAYFINGYIWIFRIVGFALIAYPAFTLLGEASRYVKFTGYALLIFGCWWCTCLIFDF